MSRLVDREAVAVAPAAEIPLPAEGRVTPSFVPFEKLSSGLKKLQPLLPDAGQEKATPTPVLFTAEAEPNNTPEQATATTIPSKVQGHVDPLPGSEDGDHDWYSFNVELDQPGVLDIRFSGVKDIPLTLEVYREGLKGRGLLLAMESDGKGQAESLPNLKLTNGRYHLHVSQVLAVDKKGKKAKPAWNVQVPYVLELSVKAASSNLAETEPNDDALAALQVQVPVSVTGLTNSPTDADWYLVDLANLSTFAYLSVELLPDVGRSLKLGVTTLTREPVLEVTAAKGRKLLLPNLGIREGAEGYYLVVSAADASKKAGAYTLTVKDEHPKSTVEVEPNDTAEDARRIPFEEEVPGYLHVEKDVDWLLLVPPTPEEWRLGPADETAGGQPPAEAGAAASGDSSQAPGAAAAAGAEAGTAAGSPGAAAAEPGPTATVPPLPDVDGQEGEIPALHVLLSALPGVDTSLTLVDAETGSVLGVYDSGRKGDGEEIPNAAMPAGPFFVKVSSLAGDNPATPYLVVVRAVTTTGKEREPNNSPETATPWPADATEELGFLALVGDRDCLQLPAGGPGVRLTAPPDAALTATVYGPDGGVVMQEALTAARATLSIPGQAAGAQVCLELPADATRGHRKPYKLSVTGSGADAVEGGVQ
jgi:hypothetical protein